MKSASLEWLDHCRLKISSMDDSPIAIYCPNSACKTPNPEPEHYCRQCRTPLPKRYLWITGPNRPNASVGLLFADRYWFKTPTIVLDTKPGLPPEVPEEISETIEPYLRLFPHNLHVPQPYGILVADEQSWLLLEQAPIQADGMGLLPTLSSQWPQTTPMRQLNWLWQLAQLWLPCQQEGVATTLLNLDLIRVDGPLVRLLELQFDQFSTVTPTLEQLGQCWAQLLPAQAILSPFLEALCLQLQQGQISTINTVLQQLDYAIHRCGNSLTAQVQLFCLSDRGPSRQKNEDACYPASGTSSSVTLDHTDTASPLIIVCDGIGGHEGGDVASQMAISAVVQQVQNLLSSPAHLAPFEVELGMAEAIRVANDLISQRNDREQRQERQRMGTTLVMAMPLAHEIYLAHIGDSRAYWITREACRQITLDDDFASRETRLGYIFYRDALQSPVAGSLVQALGMGSSTYLHPSTQRFILDEDCVFLLCSDGLSDFDRVETFWDTAILPILRGESTAQATGQRLVELANSWNGHDNVTIGLIHYQIKHQPQFTPEIITYIPTLDDVQTRPDTSTINVSTQLATPTPRNTQPVPSIPQSPRRTPLWLVRLLPLLGLVGILVLVVSLNNRLPQYQQTIAPSPGLKDQEPSPSSSQAPTPIPSISIVVGSILELTTPTNPSSPENSGLLLLPQPNSGIPSSPNRAFPVPSGTVVQVIKRQETTSQQYWLELKVCTLPSPSNPPLITPEPLQIGKTGWLPEVEAVKYATLLTNHPTNSPSAQQQATQFNCGSNPATRPQQ